MNFNSISEIMAVPLGDMIYSIGRGVGEAQAALDAGSLAQTKEIYSSKHPDIVPLKEIGYQPTFYVIPETEVELQLSLSISGTETVSANNVATKLPLTPTPLRKQVFYAAPVNASNANKYNINMNAVAKVKFKIVPVPPPIAVEAIKEENG